MRVAALVTGGKDSVLALYHAQKLGYKVEFLVTMIPQREDSWMFHYPNIQWTSLLARAVNIPLVKAETSGVKEMELQDLKNLLRSLEIEGVVCGAISSTYQKKRIDKICEDLKLTSLVPLWHEDPIQLLKEIITLKLETIIIGTYAYGFDRSWLGRKIDWTTLNDLINLRDKYHISIVGEGGEYETLVLDAPFFRKKIQLVCVEKKWEDYRGTLLVREAVLVEKLR